MIDPEAWAYENEVINTKIDALWEAFKKVMQKLERLEKRIEALEERVAILENNDLVQEND